jgi:hypothetical protein
MDRDGPGLAETWFFSKANAACSGRSEIPGASAYGIPVLRNCYDLSDWRKANAAFCSVCTKLRNSGQQAVAIFVEQNFCLYRTYPTYPDFA